MYIYNIYIYIYIFIYIYTYIFKEIKKSTCEAISFDVIFFNCIIYIKPELQKITLYKL